MIKKVGTEKYGKQKQQMSEYQEYQYEERDYDEEYNEEDEKSQNYIYMKPWMSNVKEPTSYYKDPINQTKPPKVHMMLEYAHGYRSHDCRNNIKYLKNGNIVYHTASLGVVMDPMHNT